jgi:predicted secreted Zn-dependent protease
METIERFEEDLTDKARIHGKLKAIIDVLDPIEVSTKRTRGVAEDPLMTQIRESLQNRLDELKVESDMYPQ